MASEKLFEKLKALLEASFVLTPGSDGYEKSLVRWSDAAQKKAGIIVQPTTAKDVSTAVLFAQEHSLEIAIAGGRHSTSGSSSTEGGMLIDLCKMREVTVDPLAKTITAQGGTIWEDVDFAGAKYGLATVGGTVNHTGVGGLTLGGGYGWLTGRYGLTIDNLIAIEAVLADGSIVNASAMENEDLFWALRGAGQSFGVAVSFKFQAYEQREPVWGGLLVFKPDALEKVLEFANKLVQETNGESGMVPIILNFRSRPSRKLTSRSNICLEASINSSWCNAHRSYSWIFQSQA